MNDFTEKKQQQQPESRKNLQKNEFFFVFCSLHHDYTYVDLMCR